MLSRLSRAVSVRACTGQHHCFSTTAALPLQQQDPSDLMLGSREEEEPKAVLEARKREAARSFVARKVFGSALTGLHDGGASSSAVEQDGSSQHFGNGVSLGAATTSRASTQASAESSSSSSSSRKVMQAVPVHRAALLQHKGQDRHCRQKTGSRLHPVHLMLLAVGLVKWVK
mmetsp:Transcript_16641/g.45747  ORF Transcript_16641/g.45747 Transcript_16641/m.45747 type:complete len:173 (-) Transcript_16641:3217-3735(-)